MKTVKDILDKKGKEVFSVYPDTPVFDALKIFASKNIGAVMVMDDGKVEGIMSERDYAREVILKGKSSKDLLVKEIMSPKVIYVTMVNSAEECMALMTGKRIRHLPVVENEKVVGIISIGDAVKAVIDDKEFTIDQLEQYITDRPHLNNTSLKDNMI